MARNFEGVGRVILSNSCWRDVCGCGLGKIEDKRKIDGSQQLFGTLHRLVVGLTWLSVFTAFSVSLIVARACGPPSLGCTEQHL